MRLLFVCVENSCRSQMAEGFARASDVMGVEAYSAGSRPSGEVHPRAVESMARLGIDISTHRSGSIDEMLPRAPFDAVVTMGCGDDCPSVPARRRLDWDLVDPKNLPDEEFHEIRDRIGALVDELIRSVASGP